MGYTGRHLNPGISGGPRVSDQSQSQQGYYRFPTIHTDTVIFACEEDLWTMHAGGGIPRRLTSGLGAAGAP
jgi:tricorn protease-like protein